MVWSIYWATIRSSTLVNLEAGLGYMRLSGLTPRESQVLSHVAYGLTNDEIASSLDISVETVKEHVQNVLRKLALQDRTQAAVWAVQSGVV